MKPGNPAVARVSGLSRRPRANCAAIARRDMARARAARHRTAARRGATPQRRVNARKNFSPKDADRPSRGTNRRSSAVVRGKPRTSSNGMREAAARSVEWSDHSPDGTRRTHGRTRRDAWPIAAHGAKKKGALSHALRSIVDARVVGAQ
ncbi:MAG TPA: hypothetical protein VFS55_11575 [Dokdonella sp.]|nr:hypothetical protein [Dokdonella sp.]